MQRYNFFPKYANKYRFIYFLTIENSWFNKNKGNELARFQIYL